MLLLSATVVSIALVDTRIVIPAATPIVAILFVFLSMLLGLIFDFGGLGRQSVQRIAEKLQLIHKGP